MAVFERRRGYDTAVWIYIARRRCRSLCPCYWDERTKKKSNLQLLEISAQRLSVVVGVSSRLFSQMSLWLSRSSLKAKFPFRQRFWTLWAMSCRSRQIWLLAKLIKKTTTCHDQRWAVLDDDDWRVRNGGARKYLKYLPEMSLIVIWRPRNYFHHHRGLALRLIEEKLASYQRAQIM